MPKATKLVVHFDDGTTYEIPAEGTGSIFLNEIKAKKCGHNPPYGKPPKKTNGNADTSGTLSLMSDEPVAATADTGTCYLINGVVVCPN
jgi:hypothetical protein